jgi:hypothetical protein
MAGDICYFYAASVAVQLASCMRGLIVAIIKSGFSDAACVRASHINRLWATAGIAQLDVPKNFGCGSIGRQTVQSQA